MCVDAEGRTHLIAYCTHVDESGRRTLQPMHTRLPKDKKRTSSRGLIYLQQGGRFMMLVDGALVNEPGLVIHGPAAPHA